VTTSLFTTVSPVTATAPKGGLVASVGVTNDGDSRWANGMVWRPETCFPARTMEVCGNTHQADQGGTDGGLVYYRPIGLHVETTCRNRFNSTADDEARARRQLMAASSYLLANELWLGTATQDDPYDTPTGGTNIINAYLASADANVIAGTPDPVEALGLLEEAATRAALGQDVHLHVPRALLPQYGQILVKQGQQWYTPGGALVISDAGYDGSGPAGQAPSLTSVWMYATAPVQVRLSDIDTFEFHTVADNTRTVAAERAGAATFDPCVHFAINTTLPGSIT
jgi:hypothetical protein